MLMPYTVFTAESRLEVCWTLNGSCVLKVSARLCDDSARICDPHLCSGPESGKRLAAVLGRTSG